MRARPPEPKSLPDLVSSVSRDEPSNTSQNYYSSQSVSNAGAYGSGQSFDFAKTQQAVAAAQQLASYYGQRNDSNANNSFSQLQYTSTPGSAFVSSTLPFTQQIQQNLLSTQSRTATQNNYKSSASRWEREERPNRAADDRFRARDNDRPSRLNDAKGKRNDSRDRNIVSKEGRDEFGRDLRGGERNKEKDKERERERPERRVRRSESPANSIGSQNVVRAVRRRYEPVNIPKLAILKTPLNVYDIKQRYSANLHIPSDLKEVIVNSNFTLNINDIPKPITFRVIEVKDDNKKKEVSKKTDSPKENKEKATKEGDKSETKEEAEEESKTEICKESDETNAKTDGKDKPSSVDHPIVSKTTYKYGVKVLIISLPSMSDIYDRMFGSDFDAISTGSKSYFLHFNKLLAFLVSRNTNDGFSLIGGKFNAQIDGYLPDSEEPNLIATAVRLVGEQTGMNLSKCAKWRLIATFVYNRDNSVDPMTPSLEINRVFMPDVWSAFDGIYDKQPKNINDLENDNQFETVLNNENLENNSEVIDTTNDKNELISTEDNGSRDEPQTTPNLEDSSALEVEPSSDSAINLLQSETIASQPMDSTAIVETTASVDTTCPPPEASDQLPLDPNTSSEAAIVDNSALDSTLESQDNDLSNVESGLQTSNTTNDISLDETAAQKAISSGDVSELHRLLESINDLKVAELRAELEKRGARLKGNHKKADLINKLRQLITQLLEDEDVVSDDVKNDWWAQRILSKENAATDDQTKAEEATEPTQTDPIVDTNSSVVCEENNTNETNDVIMIEDEKEGVQNEEQMVIDLVDDKTNDSKPNDVTIEDTPNGSQRTVKRKNDSQSPKESKKAKNIEVAPEVIPTKVTDGCVYVKGGENLTVITLHEALNHQRYDQFEMSIVSEVIRESLIHHFSHYILSTLIHNYKNPVSKDEKSAETAKPTPMPINYVHLSFAYFDSSHCGHILADDLTKLLNNANFTLSRKAFNLLMSTEDKVLYRDLCEPKELLTVTKTTSAVNTQKADDDASQASNVRIYEKNGTVYDMELLIDQSEKDEALKVRLNEELIANQEKISQLNEYIQELEARQKKMTTATEKQNDEICSFKRQKETMKTKYESMKKAVEASVLAFNKVLEKETEENK
ncbi:unnamed protein product [Medioppia subpectinata]|uniref:SAP domain-containing protein n=2 Tax=Medioppia subpectinata TaxID=1979941 RepID=A0A7R9KKH9_9ACAR|nr:unnamed protein product [Medioppia subpectinata]CAG2104914.1 unnamed protein product [Medioppia subpectinata]